MIVEFAGISGAGKTTVFQKFVKATQTRGVHVNRFHRSARQLDLSQVTADRAFETYYPGLRQSIEELADEGSYELKHAPRARWHWISGLRSMTSSCMGAIDEGFLHRVAYLAAQGQGRMAYLDILPKLPRPDAVILVDLPVAEARKRYIFRMPNKERQAAATGRYDRRLKDHKRARSFMLQGVKTYSQLGVAVYRVDNSGDADHQVAEIAAQLTDRFRKTAVAA